MDYVENNLVQKIKIKNTFKKTDTDSADHFLKKEVNLILKVLDGGLQSYFMEGSGIYVFS